MAAEVQVTHSTTLCKMLVRGWTINSKAKIKNYNLTSSDSVVLQCESSTAGGSTLPYTVTISDNKTYIDSTGQTQIKVPFVCLPMQHTDNYKELRNSVIIMQRLSVGGGGGVFAPSAPTPSTPAPAPVPAPTFTAQDLDLRFQAMLKAILQIEQKRNQLHNEQSQIYNSALQNAAENLNDAANDIMNTAKLLGHVTDAFQTAQKSAGVSSTDILTVDPAPAAGDSPEANANPSAASIASPPPVAPAPEASDSPKADGTELSARSIEIATILHELQNSEEAFQIDFVDNIENVPENLEKLCKIIYYANLSHIKKIKYMISLVRIQTEDAKTSSKFFAQMEAYTQYLASSQWLLTKIDFEDYNALSVCILLVARQTFSEQISTQQQHVYDSLIKKDVNRIYVVDADMSIFDLVTRKLKSLAKGDNDTNDATVKCPQVYLWHVKKAKSSQSTFFSANVEENNALILQAIDENHIDHVGNHEYIQSLLENNPASSDAMHIQQHVTTFDDIFVDTISKTPFAGTDKDDTDSNLVTIGKTLFGHDDEDYMYKDIVSIMNTLFAPTQVEDEGKSEADHSDASVYYSLESGDDAQLKTISTIIPPNNMFLFTLETQTPYLPMLKTCTRYEQFLIFNKLREFFVLRRLGIAQNNSAYNKCVEYAMWFLATFSILNTSKNFKQFIQFYTDEFQKLKLQRHNYTIEQLDVIDQNYEACVGTIVDDYLEEEDQKDALNDHAITNQEMAAHSLEKAFGKIDTNRWDMLQRLRSIFDFSDFTALDSLKDTQKAQILKYDSVLQFSDVDDEINTVGLNLCFLFANEAQSTLEKYTDVLYAVDAVEAVKNMAGTAEQDALKVPIWYDYARFNYIYKFDI